MLQASITIAAAIAAEKHWAKYDWAKPFAAEEERLNPTVDPRDDYKKYLPLDPTHARAYIPPYVRWAKRWEVNFKCPILGWAEGDYYQGINGSGPIRRVGILTMDHLVPGAAGGKTTDENIRAFSALANTKKGHSTITDEELRERLLSSYKLIEVPEDLLVVLKKYNVSQFKVGER
jgi:hypothetical protein